MAGSRAGELISDVEVNKWYPFKRLRDIEATVIETYENAGPILERAGEKSPQLDNSVKSNILIVAYKNTPVKSWTW